MITGSKENLCSPFSRTCNHSIKGLRSIEDQSQHSRPSIVKRPVGHTPKEMEGNLNMVIGHTYKKVRPFLSRLLGLFLLKMGFVQRRVNKVRSRNLITVLYFHNPSAQLFAGCVNWLIDNKYVFISVQELHDILSNRAVSPTGAVCLTVDDGWRENLFNIMPVVNALSIPICIFVSTKPVQDGVFWWSICAHAEKKGFDKSISIDKLKAIPESERARRVRELRDKIVAGREAMTEAEVIELSTHPFVTIGSHTVNHACLNRCSDEEIDYEVRESKRLLSDWTRKEVLCFSYPNGDFKGTEGRVLAESGYLMAFAGGRGFLSANHCDPFFLPRFCMNDAGSVEENICKMIGLWQTLKKRVTRFEMAKSLEDC